MLELQTWATIPGFILLFVKFLVDEYRFSVAFYYLKTMFPFTAVRYMISFTLFAGQNSVFKGMVKIPGSSFFVDVSTFSKNVN